MKKILLLLLFFLMTFALNAQEQAGRIITNSEAKSLFGDASIKLKISSALLQEFSRKSKNLLITIIEGNILIIDQDKKLLYPENYNLKGSELFHLYSSSVVQELLSKSDQEWILIEKRGEILTLTNDSYTLEYGLLCPPYCN